MALCSSVAVALHRSVIPLQEVADRVSLGLLPSSQGGWETALAALKVDTGGWLHLHHNVTDTEEAAWCKETLATLQQLAHQLGRTWHLR